MIAEADLASRRIDPDIPVVETPNLATFIRAVFEGADGVGLVQAQLNRLHADVTDASAYMVLGTLYQLIGRKEEALACQDAALLNARLFAEPPTSGEAASLTLLVFVARGDLMTNTPIELLLEGRPVRIIRLYVDPDLPLPDAAPEHDVAMIAISESDETRAVLQRLKGLAWPRPLINRAEAILDLSRDRLWRKMQGISGLVLPPTVRVERSAALALASGAIPLEDVLPGGAFPLVVRPVGSHAGKSLARVDDLVALGDYLARQEADRVYLSRFVDYAAPDGHYRKFRIALFGGRPYLAHLAVGDQWMVHYLNAGMAQSPQKRAEEAKSHRRFSGQGLGGAPFSGPGRDHPPPWTWSTTPWIARRPPTGELLVFEADVGMIVHDLDPADIFPYKHATCRRCSPLSRPCCATRR